MAGTISFGGIGSGIDVEGIISGLTNAARQPLSAKKSRAAGYRAAVTVLSDVGSLLQKLRASTQALDTAQEVGSNKTSSTHASITVTATGTATPGAYTVNVTKLASEQRTYSDPRASSSAGLGLSGFLEISAGGAAPASLLIETTDSLDEVAAKVNASGQRVAASVLFDGREYRLQIRGLDSGAANAVTFGSAGGLGDQLGLLVPANTRQTPENAELTVDGFPVTSATNQIAGIVPGVTMGLKERGVTGTVTIETDPEGFADKLSTFVDSYNAVVKKIHEVAGHGSRKASNPALSGDSSLRAITARLSAVLPTEVGEGRFKTLGSIGVRLNNDGTLKLDRAKLDAALAADRDAVSTILAGPASGGSGVMDSLAALVEQLTAPTTGPANAPVTSPLTSRKEGFEARARGIDKEIDAEEARIARYADTLRKQFTAMDAAVSRNNSILSSLSIKG
ncbi:MAG: flagellar filament capping protein FliD [Deltaproteobacteria bacterium]|nr:flagellar filament capping protein FliD [Deltaproteobacteria bacterium]